MQMRFMVRGKVWDLEIPWDPTAYVFTASEDCGSSGGA